MICDCTHPCTFDRFQPATRELMVFTKSAKRFFDLDAVREGLKRPESEGHSRIGGEKYQGTPGDGLSGGAQTGMARYEVNRSNPAGAPPLDWWLIPYTDPQPPKEPSNMTATFYVGDAIEVMGKLPEKSVDLVISSPPFLALRSYLPQDHPDKMLEGGSQATPGEYVDWLLDVVEACARVLAPHGSLCFELGDTYSGTNPSDVERPEHMLGARGRAGNLKTGGTAWPLAKSLSLIPETFRWAMVYGHNPHTGRQTEPWRLRNVIRWVRPNPPVGALGDKFRPATSELMVFCKTKDRYFDLDSVREPLRFPEATPKVGKNSLAREGQGGDWSNGPDKVIIQNPAGAPPLDWWNIPPGGYVMFPEPVNPGEFVGGTLYIKSEGCPLHEGRLGPVATAPHGEPEDIQPSRSPDSDASPDQALTLDFAPTDPHPSPIPEVESSDSPVPESPPVAKPRSKASRKTVPAPGTTTPDTPSEETTDHIGDTTTSPSSDVPNPDSPENRTAEADQLFLALEKYVRTGHKPAELEPCTCSFYTANNESTSHYAVKPGKPRNRQAEPAMSRGGNWNTFPNYESTHPLGAPPLDWWNIPPGGFSGAHYAVWPPELLVKPIKAMCPEQVCRTCGEPRRRITEVSYEPHGLRRDEAKAVRGARHGVAEDHALGASGEHAQSMAQGRATKNVDTLGFSDCGHNDWRPGLVLDPFAGSGTTLSVATGHGRDAIGIDLDERNFDLALDRVGPLILELGVL